MTRTKLLVALIGGATAVLLWLLLLPWDLSEVDAQGRLLERGGDDYAGAIAAVASIVLAIALILVLLRRTRLAAPAFVAGGLGAWAALFAWRAGTSETSGANLFMVPLLIVVIPLAVIVPLALRWFTVRRPG
jgi:hypothetical protein